ncbi:hypothetical protein LTR49_021749 [Elasticomyces elasticus]|nr:hypothetical protein LTR49_021749 [Elasticomyces elasticus]
MRAYVSAKSSEWTAPEKHAEASEAQIMQDLFHPPEVTFAFTNITVLHPRCSRHSPSRSTDCTMSSFPEQLRQEPDTRTLPGIGHISVGYDHGHRRQQSETSSHTSSKQRPSPASPSLDTRHHQPQFYPTSPVTTDRSRSVTPASSRGSSAEPRLAKRKADDKGETKKAKEKQAHKEQAIVATNIEDALFARAGFLVSKAQTAGNGASAGLYGDKKDNAIAQAAGLLFCIDKIILADARLNAALHPREQFAGPNVRTFMKEFSDAMTNAVSAGSVYAGSQMGGDDFDAGKQMCERAPGSSSKACRWHGSPDFRECRRDHCVREYQANVTRMLDEMNAQSLSHVQQQLRDARLYRGKKI